MRRSNQDPEGRFLRRKKYSNWIKIQAECEWCGEDFIYFSPLNEDGAPRRPRSFCGHKCVAESRWEGRKILLNKTELLDLYVSGWSGSRIAKHFGVRHGKIYEILKELGIARRGHTSTRECKESACKNPVEKRFHWRKDKSGCRIIYGTRCLEHMRAARSKWNRERSRELDPLRGTRKTGAKGKPRCCPRCGSPHPTTRSALACCGTDWRTFKKLIAHDSVIYPC